jgi:hypothetical protein
MAGRKARSAVFAPEVPAIHVFAVARPQDVDARDKRGHDAEGAVRPPKSLIHISNSQFQTAKSFKQPSLSNKRASSPVFFGEAPGRPVFPSSPLKEEGDGAPRGATIVLCVPAFPLGNTGRRSARHPDKLAPSGLICGVFLPAPGRAFRGRPKQGRPPSAKLLAGGSYWPPGGAPAPPGCVLCEARPRAPHPTPPPHDAS